MIPSGDLGGKGKACSGFIHLGLDAEFCVPCGLPVFCWLVFKKFTVSLCILHSQRKSGVFWYINDSWIIMLQGRTNSHKWQLDYLSPRKPPSSTRFGVAQLSTGPSGWACRPTCCFHLLVLPPIKKKNLLILADTASVTIFMGWKVWEPGGFFSCQASFHSSQPWLWLIQWRISGCHLTTLKNIT